MFRRFGAWRRYRRMSRALAELDRQDRRAGRGGSSPGSGWRGSGRGGSGSRGSGRGGSGRGGSGRRGLSRGELLFLLAIPVLAAVLWGLTQRFPSLLGPADRAAREGRPQVAQTEIGSGPYAFLSTGPDGQPVRYPSCRPIDYVINPAGMPPGGQQVISEAVGQVSAATGLRFDYQGVTDEPPTEQRALRQPDRYPERWAPVLIAWAGPEQYPAIESDVEGIGGSAWVEPGGSGTAYYVTGQIVLSRPGLTRMLDRPGGEPRARAVVMHELGHLVGLAHVRDPKELMAPTDTGQTGYGPGDREGLALLGHGPCPPSSY
jgi:hypothetical protein